MWYGGAWPRPLALDAAVAGPWQQHEWWHPTPASRRSAYQPSVPRCADPACLDRYRLDGCLVDLNADGVAGRSAAIRRRRAAQSATRDHRLPWIRVPLAPLLA